MAQIRETETTDEVIRETRRIKAALAESRDFDIDRILQDTKAKQQNSGRKILSPPVSKEVSTEKE